MRIKLYGVILIFFVVLIDGSPLVARFPALKRLHRLQAEANLVGKPMDPRIAEDIWPSEISVPRDTRFSCVVIVVSSFNSTNLLRFDHLETWVPAIESMCAVQFVYGALRTERSFHERILPERGFPRALLKRAVFLPNVSAKHSSLNQAFGILKHYHDQLVLHNVSYDWYFKVDADTYLNPVAFKKLVFNLQASSSSPLVYAGTPSSGSKEDPDFPFCLGPVTLFGREIILLLGPHLSTCLSSTVSVHDDAEIGRCVRKIAQIPCAPLLSSGSSPLSKDEGNSALLHIFYGNIQANGSSSSHNGRLPSSLVHKHAFVHPLKSADSMHAVHHNQEAALMPLLRSCSDKASCHPQYQEHLQTLPCVHNPGLFLRNTGLTKEECPPWSISVSARDISSLPTFVLSLRTPESEKNYWRVKAMLEAANFTGVRRWNAVNGWRTGWSMPDQIRDTSDRNLTLGEHGYRATLRSLLEHALHSQFQQVLLFDDDVLIDCQVHERLEKLVSSPRCVSYMWTEKRGGVLLLGSAVWRESFNQIDQELKIPPDHGHLPPDESFQCFNHVNGNFGSFAFIIHRAAYQAVIDWIDTVVKPFDWVWNHLSHEGYIVRTAYPGLFIADIAKPSTVNPARISRVNKAVNYRWNLRKYCW